MSSRRAYHARQAARALFWTIPVSTFLRLSQAHRFWSELARWVFLQANVMAVPIVDLDALYPGISRHEVRVGYANSSMRLSEQTSIAQLARHTRPEAAFEIGTPGGGTSLLMAQNTEDHARVYTLDLPPDSGTAVCSVGAAFRGTKWDGKITQLWGDSREFDFSPWHGQMDLVFVDANHDYESVQSDTENALRLTSDRGIIIWHDYPSTPGVCRAVNEFARRKPTCLIQDTRIALFDSGRG